MPALPISAKRRAHFAAVGYDTLKNLAASATDQPSSTTRRPIRARCTGVKAALA